MTAQPVGPPSDPLDVQHAVGAAQLLGPFRRADTAIGGEDQNRAAEVHPGLDALLRAAHGAVVNVSSIAGQEGQGSSIAYAASKGALNTLTI